MLSSVAEATLHNLFSQPQRQPLHNKTGAFLTDLVDLLHFHKAQGSFSFTFLHCPFLDQMSFLVYFVLPTVKSSDGM